MSTKFMHVLIFVTLTLTAACTRNAAEDTAPAAGDTTIGIDVAAMDRGVRPGDDFFTYANGNWLQATEIPADRASVGAFYLAFQEVEKRKARLVGDIVAADHDAGTDAARIADFYSAYVDTAAIDAAGMQPVRDHLDRIAAIADKDELSTALGATLRADVDPLNATDFFTENLFGVFVTQGLATPGEVLPYILQGGLGMPDREYYLSSDPKMAETRESYRAFIARLLTAAGISDAAARAERIFALEMKIAQAHLSREISEDFSKSMTVWAREDFDDKAPGINWSLFMEAAALGDVRKFAAYHADAITGLSALAASEPLEAWKDWLALHLVSTHADVLPSAVDAARFSFYGTVLNGTPEQRSRDKRALTALDAFLGDAVGRAYVEEYFPASAKAQVEDMVDNIVAAFRKRVAAIDWMEQATKDEALAKVASIRVSVGYPDTWRDYGAYDVVANDAFANVVAGEKFGYANQLAKIGRPMDRGEWWMTPQTVNAINLPVQNALNFPAGILLPPFFFPDADPAVNYGAIGLVIGHEISHSFDNNGAEFDASGAYRNWWTDHDFAEFEKQGQALAKQYDGYAPFPDLHVNGKLTLGENIADLAGLAASYDAYRTSLRGADAPMIDGFTGDERFFIGYGQMCADKRREAAMRSQIITNVHAPWRYRALTVRNVDAWYEAFGVQPDQALYLAPEERVRIW